MPTGTPVLVLGAGGHALVSVEVLRAAGHSVLGCLSRDGLAGAPLHRIGVSVLGADRDLASFAGAGTLVFVAVGDNTARLSLATAAELAGAHLVAAISPRSIVSPSAVVDAGGLVMPGAAANALAAIGTGAIVNTGALVDHECRIGAFAHIAPGAALAGNVTVGEGTLVGVGARVLPGRRIGAWATVGAGAVVVDDVPDGATVVGVPARPLERRA